MEFPEYSAVRSPQVIPQADSAEEFPVVGRGIWVYADSAEFVMQYEAVEKRTLSSAFNSPVSVTSKVLSIFPETEIPRVVHG